MNAFVGEPCIVVVIGKDTIFINPLVCCPFVRCPKQCKYIGIVSEMEKACSVPLSRMMMIRIRIYFSWLSLLFSLLKEKIHNGKGQFQMSQAASY